MKKITVNGTEYKVSGNPDMRTVKYVQEMEIDLMRDYLDDEDLMRMEESDDDEIIEKVLEDADVDDLMEMLWDRSAQSPLQTICLGTNEQFTMEDVLDMKSMSFKKLLDASKDELGGDASDFIEGLDIGISSQERMAEMIEDGESGSSEDLPPSVSDLSSEQSGGTEATPATQSSK